MFILYIIKASNGEAQKETKFPTAKWIIWIVKSPFVVQVSEHPRNTYIWTFLIRLTCDFPGMDLFIFQLKIRLA